MGNSISFMVLDVTALSLTATVMDFLIRLISHSWVLVPVDLLAYTGMQIQYE